jgi:hypothetical protein
MSITYSVKNRAQCHFENARLTWASEHGVGFPSGRLPEGENIAWMEETSTSNISIMVNKNEKNSRY